VTEIIDAWMQHPSAALMNHPMLPLIHGDSQLMRSSRW
jgi:hypothetical protein